MAHDQTTDATPTGVETTDAITQWQETYAPLATIFSALEGGFPIRSTGVTAGSQLTELRFLDNILVAFDEAIDHSDAGLEQFRELHKHAIDAGIAVLPTWPRLKRTNKKGVTDWDDKAWASRYASLVHARVNLAERRLKEIGITSTRIREFFREELEKPGRKTLMRQVRDSATPAKLQNQWWRCIDDLLQDLAEQMHENERFVVQRFWDPRYGPDESD